MDWIEVLRQFAGESGAWGVTATFLAGTGFLLRTPLGAVIEAFVERYRHRTKEITAREARDAEFTLDRLNGKLVVHLEKSSAFRSLLQERIREAQAVRDIAQALEELREKTEEHAREDVAAHERIAVVERDAAAALQALSKAEERLDSLRERLEDKIEASTTKITELILSQRWDRKTERREE